MNQRVLTKIYKNAGLHSGAEFNFIVVYNSLSFNSGTDVENYFNPYWYSIGSTLEGWN